MNIRAPKRSSPRACGCPKRGPAQLWRAAAWIFQSTHAEFQKSPNRRSKLYNFTGFVSRTTYFVLHFADMARKKEPRSVGPCRATHRQMTAALPAFCELNAPALHRILR